MQYIQPLAEYRFNLKSKKLEGLARLIKLNIPTVANPFVVLPKLYLEFLNTKKLSPSAVFELESIFNSIKQSSCITLRNSIYEEGNPGISFILHNTVNIKDFSIFIKKITQGFKKAIRAAHNPKNVEFSYLIQSFYSSEKAGILLSNNGQNRIFLQAILGQHTDLLLRGDLMPDVYLIEKKTYRISSKNIAKKEFRIKKLSSGIKKIRVKKTEQDKSVLKDDQVTSIAKLSQIVEKAFGPQEMEWAVLDTGRIIFQETRDLPLSQKIKFRSKAEIIFPANVEGRVIKLTGLPKSRSISDKIVFTNNLNIAFINKLAFFYRPKAVILTRGSLTSHAATILRESRITTLLIQDINLPDGQKIKINKEGEIFQI